MNILAAQNELYFFSYFINNGEDGLHLAYSEDGFNWSALNQNKAFLKPAAGKDKLMRDPCVIKGGDGKYHMVWTVSWNEQGIGYASSDDLIDWSDQKYLPVMAQEPTTRNCWAPEIYYDLQDDLYMIYWSTTIPGRFSETDSSGGNGYNHRMYYVTTKDFQDYSQTRLLYDQGFNVIDGTIQRVGDQYVLFLKDETKYPEAEKNVRIATSSSLTGPYGPASESMTYHWVEGPTAINIGGEWILYFDMYTRHKMGAVKSRDLKIWEDISDRVTFPEGARHGSILKVDRGYQQAEIIWGVGS